MSKLAISGTVLSCLLLSAASALAAHITVDTTTDVEATDGFCSLREAIYAANHDVPRNECPAGNGRDRIRFNLALPAVITLTDNLPVITSDLALHGPGADQLSLSGDSTYRPLKIDSPVGTFVALLDLTIVEGATPAGETGGGGGASVQGGGSVHFERVHFVRNRSDNSGGGLIVAGAFGATSESRATLLDTWFLQNETHSPAGGGGVASSAEGAVIEIVRSAFVGNQALHGNGSGGGLKVNRATVTIDASTFSGNRARANGGGISVSASSGAPSTVTMRDTTVTDNTVDFGNGGGVRVSPTATQQVNMSIENSLIADNVDLAVGSIQPDISCSTSFTGFTATGSNLIGAHDGCETYFPAGSPNVNGDFTGTAGARIDPLLEAIAFHGGPTPTHRPTQIPLSPAIDQGTCPGILADQRFYGLPGSATRVRDITSVPEPPGGDGCDIGAFELKGEPMLASRIFTDGFESGSTLRWSDERP